MSLVNQTSALLQCIGNYITLLQWLLYCNIYCIVMFIVLQCLWFLLDLVKNKK